MIYSPPALAFGEATAGTFGETTAGIRRSLFAEQKA
jgi:hypothetical protein